MTDIAIKVENLSKVYKLYDKPIDRLKESLHWRGKKYHKDFYALNDVGFEVKKGETVGIIGKNGSGKSTLLKIITGVLTPTNGKVTVNGKVSALLELGAGFNPEYTGMENIYFQGTIMGYEREEMDAKVDEILAFADIGEFINQPFKTYSSGMGARLAFAVAINVEPDILIVDEALSVGDVAFQNKCMRHMEMLMKKGVTILFVSHDTQAVNKFCNKAIWIKNGVIEAIGDTGSVTKKYLAFGNYGQEIIASNANKGNVHIANESMSQLKFKELSGESEFGVGNAKILSAGFFDINLNQVFQIQQDIKVKFITVIESKADLYNVAVGFSLIDKLNNTILTINSYMYKKPIEILKAGQKMAIEFEFVVPKIYPMVYSVDLALAEGTQINHEQHHWIHSAMQLEIVSNDFIELCTYTIPSEHVQIDFTQY